MIATPVSLNLPMQLELLAYEIHDALSNVNADVGFTSHLLNVEERKRLAEDLSLLDEAWIYLRQAKIYQTTKKKTKRNVYSKSQSTCCTKGV